jgi:hypothetical protein
MDLVLILTLALSVGVGIILWEVRNHRRSQRSWNAHHSQEAALTALWDIVLPDWRSEYAAHQLACERAGW